MLRAYDEDGNRDFVTVDFVIQATTTTSITTTTDRNLTFFESSANVAWFSALMIILLGLGIFLAIEAYRSHMFFKICSSCNECKLPKRRYICCYIYIFYTQSLILKSPPENDLDRLFSCY